MDTVNFTTINHIAREKLGLSWLEYGLADLVYNLSNNPEAEIKGWCYASKEWLAKTLGVSRMQIHRMINTLIENGLLEKQKDGAFLRTSSKWYSVVITNKKLQGVTKSYTDSNKMLHQHSNKMLHNNNNINNNINNKESISSFEDEDLTYKKRYSSIKSIGDDEIELLAKEYDVPIAFVSSKYDDLINYCESRGRRYKNYMATLRNWVKSDAIKIRKEANGRSKIAFIDPE